MPEEVKADKKVQWYYELRLDMDRKQKELDARIGKKIRDMEFPDANGITRGFLRLFLKWVSVY